MSVTLVDNVARPLATALSLAFSADAYGKLDGYGILGAAADPDAVIKALFANNEQGVFYDPSDLTAMFQDRAGTTPVTADGQPVGLILDKSRGLVLGSELVANGTFDTDLSGWDEHPSFATQTVEWAAGRLHCVGTGTRALFGESAASASTFTAGKMYKVSFTVEVVSGPGPNFAVSVSYHGAPIINLNPAGFNNLGVGTHNLSAILAASSTNQGHFTVDTSATPTCEFYIDNVSVKELAGNHAVAPSDAARPLKTSTSAADWINYDAVDDVLNSTFPSSLGSSCTVARANVGAAPTILTAQTIGTSYADSTDNAGLIIINRALTAQETTDVTAWLTAKGATA